MFAETIGYNHPTVYKLIEAIRQEQANWELQITKIEAGERLKVSGGAKWRDVQIRLKNLVNEYDVRIRRDHNHIEYLKAVAHNVGYPL